MIPNWAGYNSRIGLMHFFVFGLISAVAYCGSGIDIILITLALLFHEIVGKEINYNDSTFDKASVFSTLLITISFFIMLNLAGLLLVYIKETNKKLQGSIESNIRTLNGMNEGVIILSNRTLESPQRIAFCNKPASKLIHQIDK